MPRKDPWEKEPVPAIATALVLVGLILVVAGISWVLVDSFNLDDIHRLASFIVKQGLFGPVAVVLLQVIAALTGIIPASPLTILAGAIWGPFWGTIISLIGMQAGAVLSFFITRNALFPWMDRFLESHMRLYAKMNQRYVTRFVFISRLLPFFVFELISYGAGLTRISFRAYFWATLLGMLPMTAILAYSGEALITQSSPFYFVLTFVAITLMMALPWIVERYNPFGLKQKLLS